MRVQIYKDDNTEDIYEFPYQYKQISKLSIEERIKFFKHVSIGKYILLEELVMVYPHNKPPYEKKNLYTLDSEGNIEFYA